ncbi:MAG TPA: ATP-binding protein [Rhizomicrobium sp.]|nr:ATP-binding protein [Rhizomicrobium sp.]
MVSDRYYAGIALRIALLISTIILLAWMVAHTEWYVSMGLVTAAAVAETIFLLHYATRWSREVTRFLEAVSFEDTTARFSGLKSDRIFRELGLTMGRVMERLSQGRSEREEQAQYLQALINHVPVALLAVEDTGQVQLLNFAARRLFEGPCTGVLDFPRCGEAFAAGIENLKPGDGAILRMERKSGALQLKAAATDLALSGKRRRLISLQNIENELSAHELVAWQAVIRVMAHEVMNSLTPVTSLAATAEGLIAQVSKNLPETDANQPALADANEALETLARRSQGLLHFVQNHRRITKRMVAKLERIRIERIFARLGRLLAADLAQRAIEFSIAVEPQTLEFEADAELLDQALINLVRNAIEALRDVPDGKITLSAMRDLDGRTVISVADNGPGIPLDQREKVFVPFFTTKRQGSGVGLTLARQIATLHGGMVTITETRGGGATVSLRF